MDGRHVPNSDGRYRPLECYDLIKPSINQQKQNSIHNVLQKNIETIKEKLNNNPFGKTDILLATQRKVQSQQQTITNLIS